MSRDYLLIMYIPETFPEQTYISIHSQVLFLLICWDSRHLQVKHYIKIGELCKAIQYFK